MRRLATAAASPTTRFDFIVFLGAHLDRTSVMLRTGDFIFTIHD
jgi:hypothetical protein